MDTERALLSKSAHVGQTERLIAMGIQPEHFASPDCKEVWEFTVEHTRKYRTPPSFEAVHKKFPDFHFDVSNDAFEYVTEEFIKGVKRRAAIDKTRYLARAVDDPEEVGRIDDLFMEAAKDLAHLVPSTRVGRFSDMTNRIQLYRQRLKEGVNPGIPFGVPQLDDLTMGIQSHEYVSIVGWQGTGKSTLLQWLFFNAYLAGKTPMLISLEMEQESLFKKWDAMATHFQHRALKAMELNKGDIARWEKMAERAEKMKGQSDIIVLDDLGKCTVDRVHAEAVRYEPDIIGVDYISLLDAPDRFGALWEKVTHITQSLKLCARTLKIPLYGVAQTNIMSADEGAKLENISYSRSIGQDSDIVLGLYQSEEQLAKQQMELRVLKNRDGAIRKAIDLYWNMNTMEFREWETGKDDFSRKSD